MSTTRNKVNLLDGMKNAGIKIDEQTEKIYSDWIKKNPADDGVWGLWPRCRDEMKIDEKTVAAASKRSSCAVVAIGRSAGEDRENTLKKGSYYLTDDENRAARQGDREFQKHRCADKQRQYYRYVVDE